VSYANILILNVNSNTWNT